MLYVMYRVSVSLPICQVSDDWEYIYISAEARLHALCDGRGLPDQYLAGTIALPN